MIKVRAFAKRIYNRMVTTIKSEKGAQVIEYVGLAAVVIAIMLAIQEGIGKNDNGIGKAITEKFAEWISKKFQ